MVLGVHLIIFIPYKFPEFLKILIKAIQLLSLAFMFSPIFNFHLYLFLHPSPLPWALDLYLYEKYQRVSVKE